MKRLYFPQDRISFEVDVVCVCVSADAGHHALCSSERRKLRHTVNKILSITEPANCPARKRQGNKLALSALPPRAFPDAPRECGVPTPPCSALRLLSSPAHSRACPFAVARATQVYTEREFFLFDGPGGPWELAFFLGRWDLFFARQREIFFLGVFWVFFGGVFLVFFLFFARSANFFFDFSFSAVTFFLAGP